MGWSPPRFCSAPRLHSPKTGNSLSLPPFTITVIRMQRQRIARVLIQRGPETDALVALRRELDTPVRFVGTGESLDDLEPFDAEAWATGLVGT